METVRMTTVISKQLHGRLKTLAKLDGRQTMRYVEKVLERVVAAEEKKVQK